MKSIEMDKSGEELLRNTEDFDFENMEEEVDDSNEEFESAVNARYADSDTKSLDVTQLYLSEIGYSPLLSAEEEVYFARLSLKGDEAARK